MIIVGVIEPIASPKKQTGHSEKSGQDHQNQFDIHSLLMAFMTVAQQIARAERGQHLAIQRAQLLENPTANL